MPACACLSMWDVLRLFAGRSYPPRLTGRDGTVLRPSVSCPGGGWPLCVCRGRRAGEGRPSRPPRAAWRGGAARVTCWGFDRPRACPPSDHGGASRVCLRGYLTGAGNPAPVVSRRGKAVPRLLFGRSGRGRNGCPAPACNCAADRAFCTCLRSRGGEGRALRGRKPLRFQLLRLAARRRFRYPVGGTPYEQKSRPRCAGAGRKERTT